MQDKKRELLRFYSLGFGNEREYCNEAKLKSQLP